MKSIFDKETREELSGRIDALTENNTAQWGKMNLYQMLKHCRMFDEWNQGKNDPRYRQAFIGKLFGKMVLKKALAEGKPLAKNTPTIPEFKIKENGDIESEKKKWITALEGYEQFSNPGFIHTFFGKLTREEIGFLAYKHADHHLRQFNG